jgi:hypothetical protein
VQGALVRRARSSKSRSSSRWARTSSPPRGRPRADRPIAIAPLFFKCSLGAIQSRNCTTGCADGSGTAARPTAIPRLRAGFHVNAAILRRGSAFAEAGRQGRPNEYVNHHDFNPPPPRRPLRIPRAPPFQSRDRVRRRRDAGQRCSARRERGRRAHGRGETGDSRAGSRRDRGVDRKRSAAGPIELCGGLTLCGLTCADLQTDNNNCGSCGTVCHPFWVRHTFIDIHCVDGNCL